MDIIGHDYLFKNNTILDKMIKNKNYLSIVFYGEAGIGKTTLAEEIANMSGYGYYKLNGSTLTKKKMEEILNKSFYERVILVINEIHRLDRIKQDFLLSFLENDNCILLGTTTDNPLYTLTSALRSRLIILEMKKPNSSEILTYLKNKNKDNIIEDKYLNKILELSFGDLRKTLKTFNFVLKNFEKNEITDELIDSLFQYSITGNTLENSYYDLVSAFQKSIRASDTNASLYYLGKLILAGDYEGLFRRIRVICYEDIGLANVSLPLRIENAIRSFNKVGMPEGKIILSNIVIEMAISPKSRTAYNAINNVIDTIKKDPDLAIPPYIKHKQLNDYKYNQEKNFYQNNLPKKIKKKEFINLLENTDYEKKLKNRYEYLKEMKKGEKI